MMPSASMRTGIAIHTMMEERIAHTGMGSSSTTYSIHLLVFRYSDALKQRQRPTQHGQANAKWHGQSSLGTTQRIRRQNSCIMSDVIHLNHKQSFTHIDNPPVQQGKEDHSIDICIQKAESYSCIEPAYPIFAEIS